MPRVEKDIVKGGKILIFGDLHLSSTYVGQHKDYLYECYYNMDRITEICKESKPGAVIFLGDLIGVNERNIKDRQFLMRVLMFFNGLNQLTNGHVYSVKGNHDMGDFSDYDMLLGLGLIKDPMYIDYYGDDHIEVRFHLVNYGDEHKSIKLASSEDLISNIVLGHADYYIEGVTNWYSAKSKDRLDLSTLDNFKDVEFIVSGHIHAPSTEMLYTTLKDKSTIGLFYVGSPSRTAERFDDCWYMEFEYRKDENGEYSTEYDAKMFGLQPAKEVFFPEDDFIDERSVEVEEQKIKSDSLTQLVQEIIDGRMTGGDLYQQIDMVPGVDDEVKKIAKKYLDIATKEGN